MTRHHLFTALQLLVEVLFLVYRNIVCCITAVEIMKLTV